MNIEKKCAICGSSLLSNMDIPCQCLLNIRSKWIPSNELIATMAAAIYAADRKSFDPNIKRCIANARYICKLIAEDENNE